MPNTMSKQYGVPGVRIAELEINPARLEQYKAALKREIETSVHGEPTIRSLWAVVVSEHPAQIRNGRTRYLLRNYRL
jgi:aspartate/methionine/tyrosine aminotransferase